MNDTIENNITRRRVLAGIATAGAAGALGSAGTYALLSDTARTRTTFTSGSLDLRVQYDTTYDAGTDPRTSSGRIDGQESTKLPGYSDLKPGDSGEMRFCFEVTTNPAYLWVCGEVTADRENGRSDPERAVDDTGNDGELADAIETTVRYCDDDGTDGTVVGEANRSLSSVFTDLADGIPLDFDGRDADAGDQAAYEPSSGSNTTGPCLCIEWKLPDDVGNEVQSDEIAFDLTFHAVQARHNDGTDSPCNGSSGGGNGDGGDGSGGGDGDDDNSSNPAGISFVAFCDFNGNSNSLRPTVTVSETNDEGEAISIDWGTNKNVGHVALKTGNQNQGSPDHWESFFDNFYPDSKGGTVAVGRGDALEGQTPDNPCPDGNFVKVESSAFE